RHGGSTTSRGTALQRRVHAGPTRAPFCSIASIRHRPCNVGMPQKAFHHDLLARLLHQQFDGIDPATNQQCASA
ncbi:MAG: hypothetical protein ABIX12_04320, partial [Rubrivivax sp.]